MTDIMKLADTYADRFYLDRRYHNEESSYDRAASRAALQAAIEALQAENERLKRELEISKLDAKEWYSQADTLQAKLYAAPKALAPLTDEQIYNVFASTVKEAEPFSELVGDPIWAEVVEITRAIEAAHGIGGTP